MILQPRTEPVPCPANCVREPCADDLTGWAANLRTGHPNELRPAVDLTRTNPRRPTGNWYKPGYVSGGRNG